MLGFFDAFDFFSNETDTSAFRLLFDPREKDCGIDSHGLERKPHFDTIREVVGGNPAILGYEGFVPYSGIVVSVIIVFGCLDNLYFISVRLPRDFMPINKGTRPYLNPTCRIPMRESPEIFEAFDLK